MKQLIPRINGAPNVLSHGRCNDCVAVSTVTAKQPQVKLFRRSLYSRLLSHDKRFPCEIVISRLRLLGAPWSCAALQKREQWARARAVGCPRTAAHTLWRRQSTWKLGVRHHRRLHLRKRNCTRPFLPALFLIVYGLTLARAALPVLTLRPHVTVYSGVLWMLIPFYHQPLPAVFFVLISLSSLVDHGEYKGWQFYALLHAPTWNLLLVLGTSGRCVALFSLKCDITAQPGDLLVVTGILLECRLGTVRETGINGVVFSAWICWFQCAGGRLSGPQTLAKETCLTSCASSWTVPSFARPSGLLLTSLSFLIASSWTC